MATGQIGFHRQKQVKKVLVEKRINEIINRLNKTKVEKFPDLAAEKTAFEKEEKRKEKAAIQEKVLPMLGRCDMSGFRGRRKSGWRKRRGRWKFRNGSSTRTCMERRLRGGRRRREGMIMIPRRIFW
jgi:hypothetical protein